MYLWSFPIYISERTNPIFPASCVKQLWRIFCLLGRLRISEMAYVNLILPTNDKINRSTLSCKKIVKVTSLKTHIKYTQFISWAYVQPIFAKKQGGKKSIGLSFEQFLYIFLYSVQSYQESWWRQRESKTDWRWVVFLTLCNLIRRAGGGRGRARQAGGE